MAGIFRSSSRQPAPTTPLAPTHSRYLQPVAPLDSSKLTVKLSGSRSPSPRCSRVDLDFETALQGDGTVHLREGIDVTTLGATSPDRSINPDQKALYKPNLGPDSPLVNSSIPSYTTSPGATSSSSDDMTPTPTPSKPMTTNRLVVVPPTPDHSSRYQSHFTESQRRSSSFFKAQAAAASTPDLRKNGHANLGGKPSNNNHYPIPQDQSSSSFLSPSQSNATMKPRLRGSSSTSSFSMVSAASFTSPRIPMGKEKSDKSHEVDKNPSADWGLINSRSRSASKSGRSMRVRATNFIGRMLGQDTFRDKSQKSGSSSSEYVAPPLFARYASQNQDPPPVPDLPERFQPSAQSPPPAADVFTSPSPSLDLSKPLPKHPRSSLTDDEMAEQGFLFSDDPSKPPVADATIKSHIPRQGSVSSARRRSASVGDLESQKASTETTNSQSSYQTAETSSITSRPSSEQCKMSITSAEWDTSNILKLFKGELSQLDPISSTSLEITDPSSPERQSIVNRSRSNTTDQLPSPRSEGSTGTIRPRLSETTDRPAALGINTALDNLKANADASGSSTMKRSPASSSPNRSSLSVPDSPLRASAVRRNVSRPTVPPVSASALYASSRAASSPMLGVSGPSSPRSLNTGPPSFSNPFTAQPSVIVSSSTSNRRISVQAPPSLEHSLAGDAVDLQRRSHSLSVEGSRTVRLVHSNASISYPFSPSISQVDLAAEGSPSKSTPSASRGTSLDDEGLETKAKELASRCWKDDETFLSKEKIAEWLGGTGRLNAIALHHYIEFYDFTGLRLDHAFRRFCAKLYLKGETQQIDRILSEFSRRYWECNSTSVYGGISVVHAVAYSILLLNTDLHVADLSTHMSRSQFVRNTLQAVQSQNKHGPNSARASTPDLTYDDASSMHARSDGSDIGTSTLKSPKRSSSVHSWTSISRENLPQAASPLESSSHNASSVSVQTPISGSIPGVNEPRIRTAGSQSSSSVSSIPNGRGWDMEMENMLREIYTAVKSQEIRQPAGYQSPTNQSSTLNTPYNTLLRHRNSQRGQDRMALLKRGSIRGLQTLLPTGVSPYSSNSSIDFRDLRDGRISPSPSFATSMDAVPISSAYYAPALGFASNLSHTIIRETQEDDVRSLISDGSADTSVSISEEELALLGAPWAKEGMLCRKQYWESTGKRAKNKSWQDVFVVIQKGELDMFIFGDGERGVAGGQSVGGGNWLANAHSVGRLQLAHSLAHVLPPPGYNRQRPHCFVLTLANGAVYFFQAGTEDLLNEWVSTCNYWAARQSKEPLSGGVSNMEYGWNRVLNPLNHISTIQDDELSLSDKMDSLSVRSGRSGGKKRSIPDAAATVGRTYDRIMIHEWKPPLPPSVSSTHDEETQLEALRKQVELLNKDLQSHNESRKYMAALYAPRSANFVKAQTNWEKKSSYLLTEIVKYQTYVDSLRAAMSLRLTKRGEKALEKALKSARPDDSDFRGSVSKSNLPESNPAEAETVMGHGEDSEEEVTTPGADTVAFHNNKS